MDLGRNSYDMIANGLLVPTGVPVIKVDSAIRDNIFRLGVSYRLGAATY